MNRAGLVVEIDGSVDLVWTSYCRESWTLLVESYASQILHVSVNIILLEYLRLEICHVAF